MYELPLQRKPGGDKQTQPKPRAQKSSKQVDSSSPNRTIADYEHEDPSQHADSIQQRPKRLKRPTKSVNENIEPAFAAIQHQNPEL